MLPVVHPMSAVAGEACTVTNCSAVGNAAADLAGLLLLLLEPLALAVDVSAGSCCTLQC